MGHVSKKYSIRKHRGISNIIGSLIVLAIVASVGSVILFQGLNQINLFNFDLSLHSQEKVSELREDIIFQHVRFNPTDNTIELYLANTGSIDTTVAYVTVVKIDTQELIVNRELVNQLILIEDDKKITLLANLPNSVPPNVWDDSYYNTSHYKITISTSKGNFFSQVAEPFNT